MAMSLEIIVWVHPVSGVAGVLKLVPVLSFWSVRLASGVALINLACLHQCSTVALHTLEVP